MKRSNYLILSISFILSLIYVLIGNVSSVTNPGTSDYIVSGLGTLFGAFLITSIFTLPLQFTSGWSKESYLRKTFIGMPITLIFVILTKLI
jgi:hypothetical protein